MRLLGVCLVRLHGWIDAVELDRLDPPLVLLVFAGGNLARPDGAQHGRAIDAARYCGLDQRIAHRLVPIVADAWNEQHGDALVDKRLTSASLYGRFKGAAIPLRLSVVVGRIAAQCAHPRTACLRSLRLFMAHDAKHLFVAANVAGVHPLRRTLARPRGSSSGILSNSPRTLPRGYPARSD